MRNGKHIWPKPESRIITKPFVVPHAPVYGEIQGIDVHIILEFRPEIPHLLEGLGRLFHLSLDKGIAAADEKQDYAEYEESMNSTHAIDCRGKLYSNTRKKEIITHYPDDGYPAR